MSGYRGQYRRSSPPKPIGNKYPAVCTFCGGDIAPGYGIGRKANGEWRFEHKPAVWCGSPTSGSWFGGCPKPRPSDA